MIGYDRPLRPEWIKKVHEIWEPNKLLNEFKQPFNGIAWQVEGDEARRKARTVLLRYFVACNGKGNARRTLEDDLLVEISKKYPLNMLTPLYLAVIISEVEVVQHITDMFSRRYKLGDSFKVSDFIKYIKREFGDRDVIRRSVSSFFKTLYHFGLLEPVEKDNYSSYKFYNKLNVEDSLYPYILYKIFRQGRNKLQLDIGDIDNDPFMIFFDTVNLDTVIKEYNNHLWTISKRIGYERLTLKQSSWEQLKFYLE